MVLRRRAGLTAALAALLGGAARAHSGAESWEQSIGDLVVFVTTLGLVVGLGWQGLAPLFRGQAGMSPGTRLLVAGLTLGLLGSLLVAVGKGTLWKVVSPPPPPPESFSSRSEHGGAVARAGSYYVELARSGDEFRVWLSDELRRPIEPAHFAGSVQAGGRTAPLEARAGHRAARLGVRPPARISVDLQVPGDRILLPWSMDAAGRLVPGER